MPRAEHGFSTSVSGIVSGFIVNVLIGAFVKSGLVEPWMGSIISILSIVATIEMVNNMKYWGIMYLLGWIFALFLVGPYFLSTGDLFIQILLGILYLGIKLKNRFNRSSYGYY